MFFKKAKRIKKLEAQVADLKLDQDYLLHELNFHMEVEDEDKDNEPDHSEPCHCGGTMIPMYDEHPNWIKFCTTCDERKEM